ncbi:MAG: hypothetical protein H6721_10155 [Sandaracinus sp.]|nr:hypothetical protein [Sandaracinus sp.]MCB9632479.1 hypothetical protein [Sandaracinus sp.]
MTSPHDVAEQFRALLHRERDAVRAADLDALQSVQADKRVVLEALKAAAIDDDVLEELGSFARYNVGLIRHLVSILRGVAGIPEAPAYGGRGRIVPPADRGRVRGAA